MQQRERKFGSMCIRFGIVPYYRYTFSDSIGTPREYTFCEYTFCVYTFHEYTFRAYRVCRTFCEYTFSKVTGWPQIRRIIRNFLFLVSSWIPDLTCRISGRIPDTENSRISGQIVHMTISINKIPNNYFFLDPLPELLLRFLKNTGTGMLCFYSLGK
jgi:hypothetical protein